MFKKLAVGWHTGSGGRHDAIGRYFSVLNARNIVGCVKSVDDIGLAVYAARQVVTTGVPHTVVLRITTLGGSQTPDYSQSAASEARRWWDLLSARLQTDPDIAQFKNIVWIEPFNELDKNRNPWVNELCLNIAKIANQAGWKIIAPACNIGEPEPHQWSEFHTYLAYCSANPSIAGVSLHEGKIPFSADDGSSYDKNSPIQAFVPWLVGRYRFLNDYCTTNNLKLPAIILSEFGLGDYRSLPAADRVRGDLAWVLANIITTKNIIGVALWNSASGSEWANLPSELHPHHVWLIDQVESGTFTLPEFAPPWSVDPPPSDRPRSVRHTTNLLPQDTSALELDLATKALYANRQTWTQSHDVIDAIHAHSKPGGNIVLWNPERWDFDVSAYFRSFLPDQNIVTRRFSELVGGPGGTRLSVTPLNQRDPRWSSVSMGDGKTIGSWGCLLTAYTMMANYLGISTALPPAMQTLMRSAGAMSGPYLLAGALSTTFPTRIRYLKHEDRYDGIVAKIRSYIDKNMPVPARVDFNPATGQWEQHWVLVIGYDETDLLMADPWHGDVARISSRYDISGTDIITALFYEIGAAPPPPPPTNRIDLLPYLRGNGIQFEVQTSWGPQQSHQTLQVNNRFYQAKGDRSRAEWEEMSADSVSIYRYRDTSMGENRFYTTSLPSNTSPGVPWIARNSAVGVANATGTSVVVRVYDKTTCRLLQEYSAMDWIWVVARHTGSYRPAEASSFGIPVNDVVHLAWSRGSAPNTILEQYYYALNYGLVGWKSIDGRHSWVSEIHSPGARPDMKMETIPC